MDNPQPPQTILETLRTVEFRLGLKGYNVDEVDEYLEKAAVEAEAVQEQARQANERLRQATERIAQLEREVREAPAAPPAPVEAAVSDDTLQRTLVMAQKFVDQTKRESEAEAADVLAQAEARARSVVSQAEEQARQLSTDAERRLREDVTRLEGMRGQLAADVENMARHLESERNRLRSSLADVLKWVDDNIQPATSLMALRPRGEGPRGEGPARGAEQPRTEAANRPAQPRPAQPGQQQPTTAVEPPENGAKPSDTVAQVLDLRGAGAAGSAPSEPS
jgi:DivIVA domain-containing protein